MYTFQVERAPSPSRDLLMLVLARNVPSHFVVPKLVLLIEMQREKGRRRQRWQKQHFIY